MDFTLIKEHPVAAGGIVLAGATVVYLIYRNRSASTTAATGTDVVASTTDNTLALAQMSQQSQQDQINAALQVAGLQAGSQNLQVTTAGQLGYASIAGQLAAIQAQYGSQVQIANLAAQVQMASITTQGAALATQYAAAVDVTRSNNQTQVDLAAINAGVQGELLQAILGLTPSTSASPKGTTADTTTQSSNGATVSLGNPLGYSLPQPQLPAGNRGTTLPVKRPTTYYPTPAEQYA